MRRLALFVPIAAVVVLAMLALFASRLRPQPAFEETRAPQVESVHLTERNPVASAPAPAPMALKLGSAGGAATQSAPGPSHRVSPAAPQIARTGSVSLFVGNVDDAVSALTALAHREGGDLFSLQVSNAGGADSARAASGSMQLRVASDRFEEAMSAIAKVGRVRDRSVGAQDLTGDIGDSQAQLVNLQKTEADIRRIMGRAGEISDVLDAENRLSDVRGQIEQLEAQLKTMHAQVSYATIDVSLQAEAGSTAIEPNALAQLGTAWQSAVHSLAQTTVGLLASLLWIVVFAPYVLLVAAAAYFAARLVRRVFIASTR